MDLSISPNRLIRLMDRDAQASLEPLCEPIQLALRETIHESGGPIEYVYFPEGGLHSIIAVGGSHQIEVAHVGREGMTGLPVLSGVFWSTCRVIVQASGPSLRISADRFYRFLEDCPSAKGLMLRYQEAFSTQLAQTALANGIFNLEQRLARWMLMCYDRLDTDTLEITHEFISTMLGVRRAGVTSALHVLEGNQLIRSVRGLVTLRDRAGLERVAGHSYGIAEAAYDRLLGSAEEDDKIVLPPPHTIVPGGVERPGA
jgi:CRP-like cAMP-binding protein